MVKTGTVFLDGGSKLHKFSGSDTGAVIEEDGAYNFVGRHEQLEEAVPEAEGGLDIRDLLLDETD